VAEGRGQLKKQGEIEDMERKFLILRGITQNQGWTRSEWHFLNIALQYKGQANIEQDIMNRLNSYVYVRGSGC
jgi:hypothetical protein